jgi:hypothetical protein
MEEERITTFAPCSKNRLISRKLQMNRNKQAIVWRGGAFYYLGGGGISLSCPLEQTEKESISQLAF